MTIIRLLLIATAAAWIGLGVASTTTPGLPHEAWLIICFSVAGATLALARWASMHALRMFIILTTAAAAARAVAYLTIEAWSPLFVWCIATTQTLIIAEFVRHHRPEWTTPSRSKTASS